MPRSKLFLSVEVCRTLDSPKLLGADLHGTLTIDAKNQALLEEVTDRDMHVDCSPPLSDATLGALVRIELAIQRVPGAFFANSWQELLDHHTFRFAAPGEYFILQDNYYSEGQTTTKSSERYKAILSLISILKEAADYSDSTMDGLKLIYLTSSKFELPILYQYVSFRDTPGCADLANDFKAASTSHLEQRKVILKVVLFEMLGSVAPNVRFKELLERFAEFSKRIKDSYELYVAEFSFEKVLEEVETHKLDYTLKLNKVFSDIQSQLLAIPAALILVGTQLADKSVLDWKNVFVVLGAFIYATLMDLLIRNQKNSLYVIRDEMNNQKEHLVKRHIALEGRFSQAFQALDLRFKQQMWLVRIVDALVALMLGFSVVLFIWYSTDSTNWVKSW